DSHSTKPSSSMVGTSELRFIFLYSGDCTTPNCMPASMRSYLTPSSSRAQSAFFTLTELVLPQILSMVSPESAKSGTDHVFADQYKRKTWSVLRAVRHLHYEFRARPHRQQLASLARLGVGRACSPSSRAGTCARRLAASAR